jgi:uncharacterized delta-60 repeat protein
LKETLSMWFSTRHKRPSVAPARRPPSHRPRLELLEDRCLLSAGQLDTTFGSGGTVTSLLGSSSFAYATALQSDGKILAAGQATVGSGYQFALARYTTSGSLDTSFGNSGTVTTKIGSGGFAWAMAVQPTDGKIVLGGFGSISKTGHDFALARYTTGGSLDKSFGNRGTMTTALGSGDDEIEALAIQSDGKIVAAGTSQQSGQYQWALARYTTSGSLDTSFGSGGTEVSTFGPGSNVQAEIDGIALQSDSKILVTGYVSLAGSDGQQFAVARYNANGTLDSTFGTNGVVYVTPLATLHPDSGHGIVIQSDGKIVAAGTLTGTNSYQEWALARFNSDGSFDSTFGSGGVVTQQIVAGANVNDIAYSVALQSDGKLVVSGTHNVNSAGSPESFALGRFNTDGTLDTTFNGTGLVTTTIGTSSDSRGVLIQPTDGKIVVTGGATVSGVSNFAVARYLGSSTTFPIAAAPLITGRTSALGSPTTAMPDVSADFLTLPMPSAPAPATTTTPVVSSVSAPTQYSSLLAVPNQTSVPSSVLAPVVSAAAVDWLFSNPLATSDQPV